LEFEVESQLEGRPITQLASIIVSQVSVHIDRSHSAQLVNWLNRSAKCMLSFTAHE